MSVFRKSITLDVHPENRVYLSVADRQIESYIGATPDEVSAQFDRSLIANLLLQPGILITDILCAISGGLAAHLRESEKNQQYSLFETALHNDEEVLILPCFRTPGTNSFTAALKIIREQDIQGVREDADWVMAHLDVATRVSPCHPQKHLGTTFDDLVRELIQVPAPPVIGPYLGHGMTQGESRRLWLLTERWRTHCIDRARDMAAKKNIKGVRRGDIMNAVADDIDPGVQHRVDDIGTLPGFTTRPELRIFFQWLNEVYLYNHACSLGVRPNLALYNNVTSSLVGNIAVVPRFTTEQKTDAEPLVVSVPFPEIDTLRRVKPQELLIVRNNEGARYLNAISQWRRNDSQYTREECRRSLKLYSTALCKVARDANPGWLAGAIAWKPIAGFFALNNLVSAGVALLKKSHPDIGETAGWYIAVGWASIGVAWYANYRWSNRATSLIARLHRTPDVTISEQETKNEYTEKHTTQERSV